eukprot:8664928-Alexandrium_andersonii.AAC.1
MRQARADEACERLFAQAWRGCAEAGGRGPVSQLFGALRALGWSWGPPWEVFAERGFKLNLLSAPTPAFAHW